MRMGDGVYAHDYVDEIRNDGGYFGTVEEEVVTSVAGDVSGFADKLWTMMNIVKIVIDMPEEMRTAIEQGIFGAKYNIYDLVGCVMNGTLLPKGHGRLIDADELFKEVGNIRPQNIVQYKEIGRFLDMITYSPTIIGADKGDI